MENVVEWPYDKVLELIVLFQQRPALWDSESDEHRDRQKRQQATLELAMRFNVGKDEIERKLKNLQSHFYREIKKENFSRFSMNSADEIYKSKWFAYKAMKFLADRPRRKRNKRGYKTRGLSSAGETIKKEIITPDSNGTSTNFLYMDMNQQSDPNDSQMDFWDEKPVSVNGQDSIEFVAQANVEAQESQSIVNCEDKAGGSLSRTCSKTNLKVISNDVITSAIEFLLAEARARDASNPELNFYRSLIPDIMKLSNKKRRQFKEVILCTLNKFLNEDDIDREANV